MKSKLFHKMSCASGVLSRVADSGFLEFCRRAQVQAGVSLNNYIELKFVSL